MIIPAVNEPRTFETLDSGECWRLVGDHGVGRVVFEGDTDTQVVPTRYDAQTGVAYFRAPTFGEMARRVHRRSTSLQVDDIDHETFTGWSILLTGTAHRVQDSRTMADLWSLGRPPTWFPRVDTQWIALPVDHLHGQRVSA